MTPRPGFRRTLPLNKAYPGYLPGNGGELWLRSPGGRAGTAERRVAPVTRGRRRMNRTFFQL